MPLLETTWHDAVQLIMTFLQAFVKTIKIMFQVIFIIEAISFKAFLYFVAFKALEDDDLRGFIQAYHTEFDGIRVSMLAWICNNFIFAAFLAHMLSFASSKKKVKEDKVKRGASISIWSRLAVSLFFLPDIVAVYFVWSGMMDKAQFNQNMVSADLCMKWISNEFEGDNGLRALSTCLAEKAACLPNCHKA